MKGSTVVRFDDALLTRQATEYVMNEVQMVEYGELKADLHIPLINEGGAGATQITSQLIDRRGRAKVTLVPSDDIPLVGLMGSESTSRVRSITAAYEINFQEARTASMAGIDVDLTKAKAAKLAVEEESNEIAYLGGTSTDGAWLNGLFKHPMLPVVVSTVNFKDESVTAEQALAQLNMWASLVRTMTRTIDADTVLMPYTVMQYLNGKIWTNTGMSLMELFRKTNPKITFVDECPQADYAGFGETPAMIFYYRNPEYIAHVVPQELEQIVDTMSQFRTKVVIHKRDAGVIFRQKVCAVKVEGIWF